MGDYNWWRNVPSQMDPKKKAVMEAELIAAMNAAWKKASTAPQKELTSEQYALLDQFMTEHWEKMASG